MSRTSFVAGLLTGSGAVILVVVAVPGLFPPRTDRDTPAPRAAHAPAEPSRGAAAAPRSTDTERANATARRVAEEKAAIATLRNIAAAQTHFQAAAYADEDQDGVGEFGSFAEMSGATGVRDGDPVIAPLLGAAFRKVAHGAVESNGYRFRIYLPQAGGQPVGEREKGGVAPRETDADFAERVWCCYAWPAKGEGRTFFTNQDGDVLATDEAAYVGDRGPPPHAAFRNATGLSEPTAIESENSRGADHWVWKPVG